MSFLADKVISEGLTFDDVLLIPSYTEVLPQQIDLRTNFTRNIQLNLPMVTSGMDTVTDTRMAIAIAREGGIGVIHPNMSIDEQAHQVMLVKQATNEASETTEKPLATKDKLGRLRVAASVTIDAQTMNRIEQLVKAQVDAIVLNAIHGHSKIFLEALSQAKSKYPETDFVAGNIATAEAASDLVLAGADAVKVGFGPGSLCTTRLITGAGIPQLSAVYNVFKALRYSDVPIIADGGIRYSGDIAKAIAAGADCIMSGSLFAGVEESPGETIVIQGQKFKSYRSMGSIDAIQDILKKHEVQHLDHKLGQSAQDSIVARVPHQGNLSEVLFQLISGLRVGMSYCGAKDIKTLQHAKFTRITNQGMTESHPHNMEIANDATNYRSK